MSLNFIRTPGVDIMNFVTVRDFRTSPKSIWEKLSESGEVVITNNGKPTALMLNIADGDFEEVLKSIRQARAMRALNAVRIEAEQRGFLSDEEIEAEIQAYRKEKRQKQ